MGRVNNTIDKFGRQRGSEKGARGPPGIGFKFTDDNQYDIENRILHHVGEPKNGSDAATQDYVLSEIRTLRILITNIINNDVGIYVRQEIDKNTSIMKKRIEALELEKNNIVVELESVNDVMGSIHQEVNKNINAMEKRVDASEKSNANLVHLYTSAVEVIKKANVAELDSLRTFDKNVMGYIDVVNKNVAALGNRIEGIEKNTLKDSTFGNPHFSL